MVLHNFKLAIRSFRKNKKSFFINILGLTVGMASALLIFLWVDYEQKTDQFHTNKANLYQVMYHRTFNNEVTTAFYTPGPLAATLKNDLPEVEQASPLVYWFDMDLGLDQKQTTWSGFYAAPDFFNLFSFPVIHQLQTNYLAPSNAIVISKKVAEYYFEDAEAALGKTIELDGVHPVLITGVFENIPAQSSLQFDLVLPFERFRSNPAFNWVNEWGNDGPSTYLLVHQNADIAQLTQKINNIYQVQTDGEVANEADNIEKTYFLQAFKDRHLYGHFEAGVQSGGRIQYLRLFGLIGLFIVFIAAVNFINLATAQSTKRAKGIGIQKTIGANKKGLIAQFLSESILITLASAVLALGIVHLALPAFNLMTNKVLELPYTTPWLMQYLSIAVLIGVLAGIYPAFYLSSFHPIAILKGHFNKKQGTLWIRKALVVAQFGISSLLIIAITVMLFQMRYIDQKDLGFAKDQLVEIILKLENRDRIATFIKEAKTINGIANISSGHAPVDHKNQTSGVNWAGKDPEVEVPFGLFSAHFDLLETLGLQLKSGRTFDRSYGEEHRRTIINEKAVEIMGLKNPIGKTITLWDEVELEIIGVVEDFHFKSMYDPIQPLIIRWMRQPSPQLIARLDPGKEASALHELKNLFSQFAPSQPFGYEFLNEKNHALYQSEEQIAWLIQIFALIAILISCLGLLGLVTFTIGTKQKEIGIRKILGASIRNIMGWLTWDFLKLIVLAIFLVFPLAGYFLNQWLHQFAYHINLSLGYFLFTGLLIFGIAFLTIGWQSLQAAISNPVKSLRIE